MRAGIAAQVHSSSEAGRPPRFGEGGVLMIAPSRRPAHGPLVTRHFEFTRDQGRSIASAYEALIPVISRYVGRPREGGVDLREALPRPGHPRSSAGGA